MRNITILGSTGSIGTQTLDVIRKHRDSFNVVGLSTNRNIGLLYKQIEEFRPKYVSVSDSSEASKLREMLKDENTEVLSGPKAMNELASIDETHMLVTAVVGMVGLVPTLKAIEKGKDIALANKETLVVGGYVIKKALEKSHSKLIPVDSEHCAIFQCLAGCNNKKEIKRIILTASGGPFRGYTYKELENVKLEDALKHPTWSMGKKITIDSATLMNKGLEVIEAHWLFDMSFDKIDVVVHPQSIVHSAVEYIDGSVIAQLGVHDMRNPILYALSYPGRLMTDVQSLDFINMGQLSFEKPDKDTFKSLKLAYDAGRQGGTLPAVMNGANEVAVDLFLKGRIRFVDIPDIVEAAMLSHTNIDNPDLDDILYADQSARKKILNEFKVVQE